MARKGAGTKNLTARLIEAKTGRKPEYVKLADPFKGSWRVIRCRVTLGGHGDSLFVRFAEKVQVQYLHEVTPEMVAAFVNELRAGYAGGMRAEQLLEVGIRPVFAFGYAEPVCGGVVRKGEDADGIWCTAARSRSRS